MNEPVPEPADATIVPPGWMRPAWVLGRIRPGLRAALLADAARLRELPGWLGGLALPGLAILLPVLLSVGHVYARDSVAAQNADPWTVLIYGTFTESITFVVVVALLGLASPAAGVLIVISYGVSDLVASFMTGQMAYLLEAFLGRLVTYLLLWLLVVEVPLLARIMFEWAAPDAAATVGTRRWALVVAAVVAGALTYIWGEGARILIGAPFDWGHVLAPSSIYTQLYYTDAVVAGIVGAAAIVILGIRYLGPDAHIGGPEAETTTNPLGSTASYLLGLGIALLVLMDYVDQPIDAAFLIAGLLVARPVATFVLRVTKLAPFVARIPWPARLIAGFIATFLFASTYMENVSLPLSSRLGSMVLGLAIGLVIMEFFVGADEVASGAARPSRIREVAESVAIAGLLLLALPAVALAHDHEATADAAAGAAIAGGAAAAAVARRRAARRMADDPSDPKPIPRVPQKPITPGNPWDKPKDPPRPPMTTPPPPTPDASPPPYPWWDPRHYF